METVLSLSGLGCLLVYVAVQETRLRHKDRMDALIIPAQIRTAELQYRIERRADVLRSNLTSEDLRFLAANGHAASQARLHALETPPAPAELDDAAEGEVLAGRSRSRSVTKTAIMRKDPNDRTGAERYYLRNGRWPWTSTVTNTITVMYTPREKR